MDVKLVTFIKQFDYSKHPQKHTEKTQLEQMNSFFLHQLKFRLALFKEAINSIRPFIQQGEKVYAKWKATQAERGGEASNEAEDHEAAESAAGERLQGTVTLTGALPTVLLPSKKAWSFWSRGLGHTNG